MIQEDLSNPKAKKNLYKFHVHSKMISYVRLAKPHGCIRIWRKGYTWQHAHEHEVLKQH